MASSAAVATTLIGGRQVELDQCRQSQTGTRRQFDKIYKAVRQAVLQNVANKRRADAWRKSHRVDRHHVAQACHRRRSGCGGRCPTGRLTKTPRAFCERDASCAAQSAPLRSRGGRCRARCDATCSSRSPRVLRSMEHEATVHHIKQVTRHAQSSWRRARREAPRHRQSRRPAARNRAACRLATLPPTAPRQRQ
jgi:hypothetical protein